MLIGGVYTLDDYANAFNDAGCLWTLDAVTEDADALPEAVRESLDDPSLLVAFHFSVYVEEFNDSASMWLPFKRDELMKLLEPEKLALMATPILNRSLEEVVQARREELESE